MTARLAIIALPALAACAPQPSSNNVVANDALVAVEPPLPGTNQGLPDDRTPISEAAFTPDSAQGAANVVQTYFALLEERRYAEARRLWGDGGGAAEDFADAFLGYADYHAEIGAPGEIEGAAGSLYAEVPVAIYGRRTNGQEFRQRGAITLRRVNDVPGATEAQLRWHIERSSVEPRIGPQ